MNDLEVIRSKNMLIDPMLVANKFIENSIHDGIPITPLMLEKFLAITAEEYEKTYGVILFDEIAECGSYGPVFYSVNNKFRHFAGKPISCYGKRLFEKPKFTNNLNVLCTIDNVWAKYGNYSKMDLINEVRRENGPWSCSRQSGSQTVSFS